MKAIVPNDDGVYDLNTSRSKREQFSDAVIALVDEALLAEPRFASRTVSASAIGDDCSRRIQLDVWGSFHPEAPPLVPLPRDPRILRIFERGYWGEDVTAKWLISAGFKLSTRTPNGKQHEFVTGYGTIKGKMDGVLIEQHPALANLETPCIWEHKTLGAKSWRAIVKHGVTKETPDYADQIALYQAYKNLTAPALFSTLNADTCELWFEQVPFDQARAQQASDKAVHVVKAIQAGELLPRVARDADSFPCKVCRWKNECWK